MFNPFKRKKDYRILFEDDEWVTPEETLMDSSSHYSDIEKPIPSPVFRVFISLFIGLLCMLGFSVFGLAVSDHEYFSKLAWQNKTANFPLPPPRGLIFDIKGRPLVQNLPSYDLLVISREIRQDKVMYEKNIIEIAAILGISSDELGNEVNIKSSSNAIFFALHDITKDQALEIRYLNPKGFYVVSDTVREYVNGSKFSQILGYIGKVGKGDLVDEYYYPTDMIGRLGIEAQYEDILRGEHGNIFFTQEKSGSVNKEPRPGNNLVLNIDKEVQEKLHDSLAKVLAESGLSHGAAVVQNPKTGAVLAMASFPTYDNNIFSSEVSVLDFERLFQSRSKPLFNRVIGGTYNPGSTIKPFIGMAALEEKIITPRDTVRDCVSVSVGNFVFKNWREEYGLFDLKKAIANSCNVYFYSIGGGYGNIRGLGITKISDYLMRANANQATGVDLPGEATGFVPTPAWKEDERGEPWYLGDTFNVSIGQGDLILTPLWLNMYVSAIANGGTFYQPQVAHRIIDSDKNTIELFKPKENGVLPFSKSVISEMQTAMEETVKTGTAQVLKNLSVSVAAKTGTAEVIKGQTINALFIAYAPADNPELAMTILVEGSASNQGYAIRTANSFLTWYFNRGKDAVPSPTPIVSPELSTLP